MAKGGGGGNQIAMLINLDKCLGCHTCTVACKNLWTNKGGREYMYWNNVESKPGEGYPRNWESMGGGFQGGQPDAGIFPTNSDYGLGDQGQIVDFDYPTRLGHDPDNVTPDPGIVDADPQPSWLSNWDEEQGDGQFPNSYYFYLPRMCNHCDRPACLESCPRKAIYKREEDGIVLVDQDRCRGYRQCVRTCPYKKVFFNSETLKSEKCIFCYPRIEAGEATACAVQCPGRVRHVGFVSDPASDVYYLAKDMGVALPLHPEYETGPNVYYIPPFSGPSQVNPDGSLKNVDRIPADYLRFLFGSEVDAAIATLRSARDNGDPDGILAILNSNNRYDIPVGG
ncbi:MAG: 4Fe-4S dicluster domain-containing protein [Pseudomonadota bacterium]